MSLASTDFAATLYVASCYLNMNKLPMEESLTGQNIRPFKLKAVSEAHNQDSLIHCLSVCVCVPVTVTVIRSGNEQKKGMGSNTCVRTGIREGGKHLVQINLSSSAVQVNKQGADKPFRCNDKLKRVCTALLTLSIHLKSLLAHDLHYSLSPFRLPAALQ